MSLSDVDRLLLQRCLDRDPYAWRDFVDRFVGLVVHVVQRTASGRGVSMDDSMRDDLVSEVFLVLIRHDLAALRRFRRHCSLATYLTVIARRVAVRRMVQWNRQSAPGAAAVNGVHHGGNGHSGVANTPHRVSESGLNDPSSHRPIERIENADEVRSLLLRLDAREADVVRMYHLEGKSYQQISHAMGMSENSVGPLLHRARGRMAGG